MSNTTTKKSHAAKPTKVESTVVVDEGATA